MLEGLNIDIVRNRKIGRKHLGVKGLHLNPHGTARLALNLKATIRKLLSKFGNLGNTAYQSNVTSVSSDDNNVQKLNHCNKNQLNKPNDKSSENSNRSNATVTLQNLRLENPNRIMSGQLNINSIRNKFEMLTSLIANEIDVLLLSETKLDETFPLEQFLISGFAKLLRLDRNSKGGGIMLFIRDNIPFRLLKLGNLPSNTEALFIEINFRKKIWLCCGYNPNKSLINKFIYDIGKVLDSYIDNYDNFFIV